MSVAVQTDIVGDLRRIHAVITRALDVSTQYCAAANAARSPSDHSAHDGFFLYAEALAAVLHAHHLTEDEIAFPYVRELIRDMPYDRLTTEHRQIAAAIEQIVAAIAVGRAGDHEEATRHIGWVLARMSAVWFPHIAEEEKYVTRERLEGIMSTEEQARLNDLAAEHSRTHATPDYLAVPFMLYNLSSTERAAMAAKFPPVVRERLVPVVWLEKWSPMKPFLLPE